MERICGLFGKTKQAFYKNGEVNFRKVAQRDFALKFARGVRSEDPLIGCMKLWHMYQAEFGAEGALGRDAFFALLRDNGLMRERSTRSTRTTDSEHMFPKYANLVKNLIPERPNEIWASDITYIPVTSAGTYTFCYLSMITDVYTKEIVGWRVGPSLETKYTIEALEMALSRVDDLKPGSLIHHSDRGCQYASWQYVNLLRSHGIQISMTEDGNPKDNAFAERINNTMKNELLHGKVFHNIEGVEEAVRAAVDFYNNRRPHMSIGMLTPAEAAEMTGRLEKRWKSRREEAILMTP